MRRQSRATAAAPPADTTPSSTSSPGHPPSTAPPRPTPNSSADVIVFQINLDASIRNDKNHTEYLPRHSTVTYAIMISKPWMKGQNQRRYKLLFSLIERHNLHVIYCIPCNNFSWVINNDSLKFQWQKNVYELTNFFTLCISESGDFYRFLLVINQMYIS